MSAPKEHNFASLGRDVGELVADKQEQYGDSVGKTGGILKCLYPTGIQPHAFDDALLIVRILDKISRLANQGPDGVDKGGESPWRDICGYALLGLKKESK